MATSIAFAGLTGEWSQNGGDCSTTLNASASCTYIVRLVATSTGAKADTIELDYNDHAGPATQVTKGVSANIFAVDSATIASNTFTGDDQANTITGGLGGDTINGGAGDDVIYADLGSSENYIDYLKNNTSMVL